jgi:hypothetical protein
LKKSLLIALALLLLPATMLISSGTAIAAKETEASLRDRLLTNAELADALKIVDSKVELGDGVDMDSLGIKGLVSAGRVWVARDGSAMVIALLSPSDGSALSDSDKKDILGDSFASGVMESFFCDKDTKTDKCTGSYKLEDSLGTVFDDRDIAHHFSGKDGKGKVFDVHSVTFVRDNIFGIVYYSSAKPADGTEAGAAFGYQSAKLPN